ncbi:DUF4349 domain-containing protein [Microbacterium sp. LjRoot45]|uniref:DUF4349 domain-containing protein n=1 Tax=Microbacterium sp. LjRoot45 TaxID=3342329 RepID=UPI003ECF2F27
MNDDMNTEDITLPELTDARVDEIERSLFAAIDDERRERGGVERARRARRGRMWLGAAGAAAVVVVAAVLAPSMPALLGGDGSASTAEGVPDIAPATDPDLGGTGGEMTGSTTASEEDGPVTSPSAGEREIIATASATVRVTDAEAAAAGIGEIAEAAGGYVEAMSVGTSGSPIEPYPVDPYAGEDVAVGSAPPASSAWITVRVPAVSLTETTNALSDIGDVTSSQVDRRDVTAEAIDVRARIDALSASVDRLRDLVGQAESTADLIAAEDALATRQSELEAYQQQLKYLDEQVGMSTLTVSLFEPAPVVTADPAGFGDGVAAGWNGLVAALNGFVIAVGFLLPWLAVLAVAGLIVWGVRRVVRDRRGRAVETASRAADDER